jgi:hypothetical protein
MNQRFLLHIVGLILLWKNIIFYMKIKLLTLLDILFSSVNYCHIKLLAM